MHTYQDYSLFALKFAHKVHLEAQDALNFAYTVSQQAQSAHLNLFHLLDQMNQLPCTSELSGTILLPDLPGHC